MRLLMDSNGELTVWGQSIIGAYRRVNRFSLIPEVGVMRRRNLTICGSRIFNYLSPPTRDNCHLLMTARDPLRLPALPSSWTFNLAPYKACVNLLDKADYVSCERVLSRMEIILRSSGSRALLLNSTMDPINRLWLLSATKLGLKTICIQHGVYSTAAVPTNLEENVVDTYVALDDGQKAILGASIPPEKILVLGAKQMRDWAPPKPTLNICFVGEDWERYGELELKERIIQCYLQIVSKLQSSGSFNFYYKPHPSEENFMGVNRRLKFISRHGLNNIDVFLGFSSTLLKEQSSAGKLCIQILDVLTRADDFQSQGYCLSLENNQYLLELLTNLLREPQRVPYINNRSLDELIL